VIGLRSFAVPALVSVLAIPGATMAIEQPAHQVLRRYPDFEVRDYAPRVVAETEVRLPRAEAGNEGFRRLAGYIFGKNRGEQRLAMTAPVAQSPGTRIAMTAPVAQLEGTPGAFVLQFTMPASFSLATLPEPLDPRVTLREEPARRVAVWRYSGTWSEERYRAQLAGFRAALAREGLAAVGEPTWARYDPPWMPWFLRTNEIWLELAAAG
jgi:hypothetical protein